MFIIQAFHQGGPFMYCILLLAVFTAAVMLERFYALFFRLKQTTPDFRQKILTFIENENLTGANEYIETNWRHTSLGRIIRIGTALRANAAGEEELQARMDEQLAKEISRVDRRTGFLAMFGNVATLLGLLGTITGMIHSFAAVASASPSDRAAMLSRGISEAMNCTAFGLIVAIPALIAYAFFQNKTDRFVTNLTEKTTAIYHDLLFFIEPGTNKTATTTMPKERKAANTSMLEV